MFLFILFVLVPIIEISLFIQVGQAIGGFNTIALIILTAFIGATLVRRQGLRTLQTAQLKMAQGQPPGQEMLSGLMLFVAGLLFVTPGFFTDALAVLLLLPPVQQMAGLWLMERMQVKTMQSGFRQEFTQQRPNEGDVFEAEYEEKSEPSKKIADEQEKNKHN